MFVYYCEALLYFALKSCHDRPAINIMVELATTDDYDIWHHMRAWIDDWNVLNQTDTIGFTPGKFPEYVIIKDYDDIQPIKQLKEHG